MPVEANVNRGAPRLIVGVGASAGGLDACKPLLADLPPNAGLTIVVILHLDPSRASYLHEILGFQGTLPVMQVTEPTPIERDHIYVIAPGTALSIEDGELRPGPPLERGGTGSGVVDMLFSSLARAYGPHAACIVLSGIGSDGSAGLVDIAAAGGLCIAQDPATAQHDGMPRSAIETGRVHAVLAPEAMGALLLEHARHPHERVEQAPMIEQAPSMDQATEQGARPDDEASFEGVLQLLATNHRFDARNYKKGTLRRRAERRLVLAGLASWTEYLRYLSDHPEELEALHEDVLIGVTQFFRDPEQWDYLEQELVPRLLEERADQEVVRVWSAGCATGEEAYGLAMIFLEQLERSNSGMQLRVFATDSSERAINHARRGLYPASIADHVAPERLAQFFSKVGDSYQIVPSVRDVVTLARHDVITEPPFSRVDLISCRNLFIYLEPRAQQACIERFHYALRRHGVLWLGGAETVNREPALFSTLSAKYRIYQKNEALRSDPMAADGRAPITSGFALPAPSRVDAPAVARSTSRIARSLELYVLEHRCAACVVINAAGHVLHLFGPTPEYLTPPPGELRLDLLSWVRDPSTYARLRTALKSAVEQHETVKISGVPLPSGDELARIEVTIEPIPSVAEGLFLVTFADEARPASAPTEQPELAAREQSLVQRLTEQLRDARAELQTTLEELDNANEEYRASYEELVSLNEELQSSNEELETTKEEAQSINEELLSVNRELEERNDRLRSVNADLENLLALTTVAVVFLDRELRIRRFTPAAERVMWLVPGDQGRPIHHIQKRVSDPRLLGDAEQVLHEVLPIEAEVRAEDGRWYNRKIVPYRVGDRIDGVCLIFYDITPQKLAAEQSEEARYLAESIVRSSPLPFIVLDHARIVVSANDVFYEAFATKRAAVEGRPLQELGHGEWDAAPLRELLERVVVERIARNCELGLELAGRGPRRLRVNASMLERPQQIPLILLAIEDVTDLRDAQDIVEQRTREHERKDEFLAMLGHELRNPVAALVNGLELLQQVGNAPEHFARIHPMLVRQTRRMTVMLDQLLDIARVSSGKVVLDLQPVDVCEVVSAAIEAVQPMITAAQHQIVTSLPRSGTLFVRGDLVRLIQVLENLLSNAAKYTGDGGTIWLTIEGNDEWARISVRDTGVGIEPELLSRIFDVFTQGPQKLGRSEGGLGLGLSLVRLLVGMHGGEVTASSPGRGQGSEFVLTLPRTRPNPVLLDRHQQGSPLRMVSPRRVLVVDDEQDVALTFAELVRSYGHDVQMVFDGRSAIAAARSFEPDVVFLDLGLPDMDGYEVATQLRAHKAMRIVALTGYPRDNARLREAGIDDHVIKPIEAWRLAEVLADSP